MKQNKIHLYIFLFSAILFALVLPTSLMAQSESYLDTIYRAVNGSNTYSSDYETDTEVEVLAETKEESSADSDSVLIYAEASNATRQGGAEDLREDQGNTRVGEKNKQIYGVWHVAA